MKRLTDRMWLLGCCAAAALTAGHAGAFQQPNAPEPGQPEPQLRDQERETVPAEDKEVHQGEFAGLEDGEFKMTIDGERKHSHRVTDQTQVMIDGRAGRLQDLKEGDRIKVTLGEGNVALQVEAVREKREPSSTDRERAPVDGEENGVDLGARVQASPTTGVFLAEIEPQGSAAASGLRRGDYILSINGDRIDSPQDLGQALAGMSHGERARMEIWRNNQRQRIDVTFREQRQTGFRGLPQDQHEDQLLDDSQRQQPWIGVTLRQLERQQGVWIDGVQFGSPAARAGLFRGDRVLTVDGRDVTSPEELADAIAASQPGEQVEMRVRRGNQELILNVVPAARILAQRSEQRRMFRPGDPNRSEVASDQVSHLIHQHERLEEQHMQIEQRLDEIMHELREIRRQLGRTQEPGATPTAPARPEEPSLEPAELPEAPAESPQPE